MDDTKDTEEPCFICRPVQEPVKGVRISSQVGKISFDFCSKHEKDEVGKKLTEVLIQQLTSTEQSARFYRTATEMMQANDPVFPKEQQPAADANPSPSSESQEKPAYGQSDFLVQNLPPGTSDTSQNETEIRETEKILQLANILSQLEVAESALSSAYDLLKDFDKDKLPVRTLKQRMRMVREAAKEMVAMTEGGESYEQGEEAESGGQ